jgi:predicted O-methyltransferase YrrM
LHKGTDLVDDDPPAIPADRPSPIMAKPIYTGEFCAFSAADDAALSALAGRVLRPGSRFAEIGSWLGTGSTQPLLRAVSSVPDARLLCIDTWAGSFGVRRHSDIVAHYDALATFRHNTAAAADRMDILVAASQRAATLFADATFDLVFIDADHRYAAIKADISAWRSKVRAGGILCGHDCETRLSPEIAGLVDAFPDADALPMDGFRFSAVHPGCVRAVHESFHGTAELMADRSQSTIWAVYS